MNELYIHMAVWDEPELDLPMVGSCGAEWGEERMEKGKSGEPKGGKEMKGGGQESKWKERRGNDKE